MKINKSMTEINKYTNIFLIYFWLFVLFFWQTVLIIFIFLFILLFSSVLISQTLSEDTDLGSFIFIRVKPDIIWNEDAVSTNNLEDTLREYTIYSTNNTETIHLKKK